VIELAAVAAKSPSAWDQPGTLAFIVIFGMGVILFFVFRSMARHLRKVNEAARLAAAEAEASEAGASEAGAAAAGRAGGRRADDVQAGQPGRQTP
jgi:hypothetical protein